MLFPIPMTAESSRQQSGKSLTLDWSTTVAKNSTWIKRASIQVQKTGKIVYRGPSRSRSSAASMRMSQILPVQHGFRFALTGWTLTEAAEEVIFPLVVSSRYLPFDYCSRTRVQHPLRRQRPSLPSDIVKAGAHSPDTSVPNVAGFCTSRIRLSTTASKTKLTLQHRQIRRIPTVATKFEFWLSAVYTVTNEYKDFGPTHKTFPSLWVE